MEGAAGCNWNKPAEMPRATSHSRAGSSSALRLQGLTLTAQRSERSSDSVWDEYFSLDHHAHEHSVSILHGQMHLRLGEEKHEPGPGDVEYYKGAITHRFGLNDASQAVKLVVHPGRALKVVIVPEGSVAIAADSSLD